jgi:hypothetical protein
MHPYRIPGTGNSLKIVLKNFSVRWQNKGKFWAPTTIWLQILHLRILSELLYALFLSPNPVTVQYYTKKQQQQQHIKITTTFIMYQSISIQYNEMFEMLSFMMLLY